MVHSVLPPGRLHSRFLKFRVPLIRKTNSAAFENIKTLAALHFIICTGSLQWVDQALIPAICIHLAVCTTEIGRLALKSKWFSERNVKAC
jgi:hypothetical protein